MADAILSFAVESIGKLLIEEANFLQGVGDQVNQLNDDLKWMEWFLKDADKKQSVRERVQPWISEFKAIAYEANDLVEDYVFRVASQNKEGVTDTLKRYACIFGECHTRHSLGMEIQSLRNRNSDLTKKFGDYGVPAKIEGEGSSSLQQQLRQTYSFFSKSEEDFVGLESDVNMLVKYLVNEDGFGHKSMVSICGMGGIGKTTLAKKVYHHPRVRQQFQGFAWFCISQQRSTKEILQGILVKLVPEQEQQILGRGEDRLVAQLREVLQGRRCLIILDDIWSNDAWDCIKPAFCISENGSKLLLTTRNIHVAEHVDPGGYHHQPRLLTEEESWKLLEKKSLKNGSAQGLMELTLSSTNIEEDPMPTLEKFPNLRKLIFYTNSFVGKEMICHAMGFPQLKLLQLMGLENLEKWEVDEGAMPKPSCLYIRYCYKLKMIPDGLRSITILSEIALVDMPEEFRNRVQIINGMGGPDFDKIRHVPSVIVKL